MRAIGFSTGAISRGKFRFALQQLQQAGVDAIELSALRLDELEPLLTALPTLPLHSFKFVSIHAPSRFEVYDEAHVIEWLTQRAYRFPIVVHPDVIFTPELWAELGNRLLIENMDKRKPVGRTVAELGCFFARLPQARFCCDIGHARQVDPSMTEAALLLREFRDRLAEIHISEVNTSSRHDPISTSAVTAFRSVAKYIPDSVPLIIESLIDEAQSDIPTEIERARDSLLSYEPTFSVA